MATLICMSKGISVFESLIRINGFYAFDIGDTRNYLVHYDRTYEKKKLLFGLTALFYLHEKLRYILIFNLLKHIGIDNGSQINAFKAPAFQNKKWTVEFDYCVKIYEKVYQKPT